MAPSTWGTFRFLLFFSIGFLVLGTLQAQDAQQVPTESECRPYIEKALKQLGTADATPETTEEGSEELPGTDESATSEEQGDRSSTDETSAETEAASAEDTGASIEDTAAKDQETSPSDEEASTEETEQISAEEETARDAHTTPLDETSAESQEDTEEDSIEKGTEEGSEAGAVPASDEDSTTEEAASESVEEEGEEIRQERSAEETAEASTEEGEISEEGPSTEETVSDGDSTAEDAESAEKGASAEGDASAQESESDEGASAEETAAAESGESTQEGESAEDSTATREDTAPTGTEGDVLSAKEGPASDESTSAEGDEEGPESGEDASSVEEGETISIEEAVSAEKGDTEGDSSAEEGGAADEATSTEESDTTSEEKEAPSVEGEEAASDEQEEGVNAEESSSEEVEQTSAAAAKSAEDQSSEVIKDISTESTTEEQASVESGEEQASAETSVPSAEEGESIETHAQGNESAETSAEDDAPAPEESVPEEEELTLEVEIPENLRQREHVAQILRLDSESLEKEMILAKAADATLKELKRVYDNAIKPLEILFKYRELSNRHFGDPEIFSKPLILFMGPWSGGKSTIINYLLDNEYTRTALRTGAEPSPAYFNILMWGDRVEVVDGTQLAADWTFSGLQKFGQGLLDRLRGLRLPNPLLEKVNIVEIPGILEIRKQVERLFPFNDACQWFIDRADIIFLVYDPSKLDVGPETEAILDQLKGREYQTRIILNKADQVRPEELMRVQGTLIWNISPLMSSSEPPVMYSTSLWSLPYETGAPTRLLLAQERAFLRDLRDAIDKRVENKIASARRFAVRVRNHAKMVDCYLTTYYNHKSFFGNKKKVSDDIIEHPQDYHIYEGLSTLTNISRYDLPDPDVYRDFFRLNPLYDFPLLSSTCTYFRGCPINRLDVAIAYDLPELVGKYKKSVEATLANIQPKS